MTTDRKEQLYGAPDLKLATADWGGRPLNGAKPTNNQASEDEISPLSTAVVSRPDLAPVCASKTVPTPGWDQDRSGRVNAAQPDAHLNHAPCATATPSGLIAEVRRAVREELFEVMRESQAKGEDNDSEATAEWDNLFTSEGHATPRFGQIMRVLSNHIIFSSEAPDMCGRVADFMFFMKCQYHLVQQNEHSRPLVPALTVIGFAQYYMSCILAYPDTEFRRLEKIVADVPSIVVVVGAGVGLSDVNEGKPPPEVLPKVIRRHQLPPGADAKSKRLLDGAFEDLMYDLDLLPPAPKREPPPLPPPHLQTTTATVPASSSLSSSVAPVQPKTAATVDKPDSSSSATLGHSRSLTRRKYVQPTLLHTIGDDDGAGDDSNTNKSDKSSLDRERELERASMSGPRQGFTRLHSWHADNKSTTGGGGGSLAGGVTHRPASEQQQQRHGGRASQPFPPPNAAATAAAGHVDNGSSAAGINAPSSAANDTRPPPRGSVSSNASSVGYFRHGGRTPPPTRQNSTSVPDVSSPGRFSFSSSSSSALGMTTPTSASVGSPGGGPASPTASWNPLQYRPMAAAVAEPSRSSSTAGGVERQQDQQQQKPHHVRWEGVPQQQPAHAAATAAAFRTGSIGGGGSQSVNTEQRPSQRRRHHRRFPSSGGNAVVGDDNDGGGGGSANRKGETWEEFLRAQKKGEGYHSR
ncbi:hypothetical protein PG996_003591 [Apiospora saccharicola]|uniref:DUF7514 domain-containing protein n=1 Tax=Apiospora saccharicola TaxID=335842 RepID=A0ABR1W4B9_9PEZI